MKRVARWAGAFIGIAALVSIEISGIMVAMAAAAWFALGSKCPPFPWEMLRFFLAIGWLISLFVSVIGFLAEDPEGSTPAQEGERRRG